MLLILIKDLVKKRSFCCVEESDVLGSSSPSTGVLTFFAGAAGGGDGGNLTARELRSNLVPRVLSYTQRRVSGMREPRERGWLRSRSSLRTLTYFRSS